VTACSFVYVHDVTRSRLSQVTFEVTGRETRTFAYEALPISHHIHHYYRQACRTHGEDEYIVTCLEVIGHKHVSKAMSLRPDRPRDTNISPRRCLYGRTVLETQTCLQGDLCRRTILETETCLQGDVSTAGPS
jgi:hypothetical protein